MKKSTYISTFLFVFAVLLSCSEENSLPNAPINNGPKVVLNTGFEGAPISRVYSINQNNFSSAYKFSDESQVPSLSTVSYSGSHALNFIPAGNRITGPKTLSFSGLELGQTINTKGYKELEVSFIYLSNSNPRPADVHNCDSWLSLHYKSDSSEWDHATSVCGFHVSEGIGWTPLTLSIPTNSSSSISLGFLYELQNNFALNPGALFLVDDLKITLK